MSWIHVKTTRPKNMDIWRALTLAISRMGNYNPTITLTSLEMFTANPTHLSFFTFKIATHGECSYIYTLPTGSEAWHNLPACSTYLQLWEGKMNCGHVFQHACSQMSTKFTPLEYQDILKSVYLLSLLCACHTLWFMTKHVEIYSEKSIHPTSHTLIHLLFSHLTPHCDCKMVQKYKKYTKVLTC